MSSLILTTAQAEAVYSAMYALINVGDAACVLYFSREFVSMEFSGAVRVSGQDADEEYASRSAFAAAYNLE